MSSSENKLCIFCTLPEIRERSILENDLVRVFPTNIPIVEGHTLIIPRRCARTLAELTNEERLAVLDTADRVMSALGRVFQAEGFNLASNQGKLSGQSVAHFHLHILPRREGDTGLADFDAQSHLYRTGEREPTEHRELCRIRDVIASALE